MSAPRRIELVPDSNGGAAPPPARRAYALGVCTALFLGALVWLFGTTPPEIDRPANVASLPSVDGTLLEVDERRLVLEPFAELDGRTEVTFRIRPEDAEHFDIAHLRSHSSISLPTRLYYERVGTTYYAVYKEDAPANSAREAGAAE